MKVTRSLFVVKKLQTLEQKLPQLPLELQILILHCLGRNHLFYNDPSCLPALASCCLVCQAWLPIAQKYLVQTVVLRSDKHLKQLVSHKLTSSKPRRLDVEKLEVRLGTRDHRRPFHHLVPYYTANRLSSLQVLEFWGFAKHDKKEVFPVSIQFTMHLSRFQHVTSLLLWNFHFQVFWDLRRFVVALPALSSLNLDKVTWPPFSEDLGILPSLPFIAHNLQKVSYWDNSTLHGSLWFWVTTHKLLSLEHQRIAGCHAENRCPALTVKDVAAFGRYVAQLNPHTSGYLHWGYSEEKQYYGFQITCVATEPILVRYHISFFFEPLTLNATLAPLKKYIPPHRQFQIGRVRGCKVYFSKNHQGWEAFDTLCDSFEHLREVRIYIPKMLSQSYSTEHSFRRDLRRVAALFPQIRVRARTGLLLIILDREGKGYLWEPGVENDAENEISEETPLPEDSTQNPDTVRGDRREEVESARKAGVEETDRKYSIPKLATVDLEEKEWIPWMSK